MRASFFDEPELEFGTGRHIDIRYGLMAHGPLDFEEAKAPHAIKVGIVGTNETIEGVCSWLSRCRTEIAAKESRKPNYFPMFPGFNLDESFQSELVFDSQLQRTLSPTALRRVLTSSSPNRIVTDAVALYLDELRYLGETADVLLCAHPQELLDAIEGAERTADPEYAEATEEEEDDGPIAGPRLVFHDMLKAEAMSGIQRPLQIIRPSTYDPSKRKRQKRRPGQVRQLQDEATRAWNLHTALYYKAGGVPWRLVRDPSALTTCFVGISFYVSLNTESVMTSMAQVFNQRGEGVIVRGGVAQISKEDRQPHLSKKDACALLQSALKLYWDEHKTWPARVVLHKTSTYSDEEKRGFFDALDERGVEYHDFLSLTSGTTRLLRYGAYAPLRGTLLTLDDQTLVLYTKGSVDFYQMYPGMYIPTARLLRLETTTEAPARLAHEVLSLTKMNWNNTQFDGGLPITLRAAKQVGLILRYIPHGGRVERLYRYYM